MRADAVVFALAHSPAVGPVLFLGLHDACLASLKRGNSAQVDARSAGLPFVIIGYEPTQQAVLDNLRRASDPAARDELLKSYHSADTLTQDFLESVSDMLRLPQPWRPELTARLIERVEEVLERRRKGGG